ncbi:MAG TPA: rod shape-determining protein RodA [bacterium]|nr:rod shape-determining protein RodA [bacterium]HPT29643.1 rod shape-determining protein RodA [bacterium]
MRELWRNHFKNFDWLLLAAILLLVCFGLIEIYSIAMGQGQGNFTDFRKQLFFVILGSGILVGFSFVDFRFLKSLYRYLYFFGIFLLLAVLVLGQSINGTKGWFSIFGFGIQPVELVKIILIIFLARLFANPAFKSRPLKYFLLSGAATMILVALVLAQPDFGSALILSFIWVFMLIVTGFHRRYFIAILLVAAVIFSSAWLFFFQDYQKERILTFLNPSYNSLNQGYNINQAIIAVGSGGITGRGVGFGSQSQLKFLPESHTDFIFAVVAEELGFLGIVLIFSFYSVFFFRSIRVLEKINDDFAIFVVLGGMGLIFVEMFINIGMNIGLLPVVGIALPFISYGGSSILASLMLVGIIQNIIIKSRS